MKKVACVITVLIMLMVLCSSAFAKTKEELQFRSIAWGTNFRDTISALDNIGITLYFFLILFYRRPHFG